MEEAINVILTYPALRDKILRLEESSSQVELAVAEPAVSSAPTKPRERQTPTPLWSDLYSETKTATSRAIGNASSFIAGDVSGAELSDSVIKALELLKNLGELMRNGGVKHTPEDAHFLIIGLAQKKAAAIIKCIESRLHNVVASDVDDCFVLASALKALQGWALASAALEPSTIQVFLENPRKTLGVGGKVSDGLADNKSVVHNPTTTPWTRSLLASSFRALWPLIEEGKEAEALDFCFSTLSLSNTKSQAVEFLEMLSLKGTDGTTTLAQALDFTFLGIESQSALPPAVPSTLSEQSTVIQYLAQDLVSFTAERLAKRLNVCRNSPDPATLELYIRAGCVDSNILALDIFKEFALRDQITGTPVFPGYKGILFLLLQRHSIPLYDFEASAVEKAWRSYKLDESFPSNIVAKSLNRATLTHRVSSDAVDRQAELVLLKALEECARRASLVGEAKAWERLLTSGVDAIVSCLENACYESLAKGLSGRGKQQLIKPAATISELQKGTGSDMLLLPTSSTVCVTSKGVNDEGLGGGRSNSEGGTTSTIKKSLASILSGSNAASAMGSVAAGHAAFLRKVKASVSVFKERNRQNSAGSSGTAGKNSPPFSECSFAAPLTTLALESLVTPIELGGPLWGSSPDNLDQWLEHARLVWTIAKHGPWGVVALKLLTHVLFRGGTTTEKLHLFRGGGSVTSLTSSLLGNGISAIAHSCLAPLAAGLVALCISGDASAAGGVERGELNRLLALLGISREKSNAGDAAAAAKEHLFLLLDTAVSACCTAIDNEN